MSSLAWTVSFCPMQLWWWEKKAHWNTLLPGCGVSLKICCRRTYHQRKSDSLTVEGCARSRQNYAAVGPVSLQVDRELPPGLKLPGDRQWLAEDEVSSAGVSSDGERSCFGCCRGSVTSLASQAWTARFVLATELTIELQLQLQSCCHLQLQCQHQGVTIRCWDMVCGLHSLACCCCPGCFRLLVPCGDQFRYITANEYAEGVEAPQPPRVQEQHHGGKKQQQQQPRQPRCQAGPDAGDSAASSASDAADGRPLRSVNGSSNATGTVKAFCFSSSCREIILRRPGESLTTC